MGWQPLASTLRIKKWLIPVREGIGGGNMKTITIHFKSGALTVDSAKRVAVTQLTLHYVNKSGVMYTYLLSLIDHFEVE